MPGYNRIVASCLRNTFIRSGSIAKISNTYGIPSCLHSRLGQARISSLSAAVVDTNCHQRLIESAKKDYDGNQDVDAAMAEMLATSRLVLFMEGSLDHPKSLCAGNLSKIFTSLQITGIMTVDLLRHPKILGYLCTHLNESVRNVLFKDGKPMLDYDGMMELFKKGTLLQALEVTPKKGDNSSHKHFREFLPIANY